MQDNNKLCCIALLLATVCVSSSTATGNISNCSLDNIEIYPSADVYIDSNEISFYRYHIHVLSYVFISNVVDNNTDDPLCVRALVDLDVNERRCNGVVEFLDGDPFYRHFEVNITNTVYNVSIDARQLGSCVVDATIQGEDINGKVENITERDIVIKVLRERTVLDQIFQLLMLTLLIFGNIAMGLKTDIRVVIAALKRPVGPAIALAVQFFIQPLIAFALINIFGIYPEILAFGFFLVGCSPSGTASNFHAFLLGGDVSLAVTVTLCSTILSLASYPLWIYTIGAYIMASSPYTIEIPFTDIVLTLAEVVVPVFIGIIIKSVAPKVAEFVLKFIVQPYLGCLIIYMLSGGIYTNVYLFEVVSWQTLMAGCLLPYLGFIIAYIVARLFKQPKDRCISIFIEAGLQNVYIPIYMLRQTFGPPEGDLAAVGPLGSMILGPIPMYLVEFLMLLRAIYRKSERIQRFANRFCCCCCPAWLLAKWASGPDSDGIEPIPDVKESVAEGDENERMAKAEANLHRSLNASATGLSESARPRANSKTRLLAGSGSARYTANADKRPLLLSETSEASEPPAD